jgi:GT2 family glycosyltransferase
VVVVVAGAVYSAAEIDPGVADIGPDRPVEITSGHEFWHSPGADVASDAVVLFLREGDRLDKAGRERLWQSFNSHGRLYTFDTYHRSGAIIYPVLQPGANPEYVRSVDATFSRFAIRGELLRSALRHKPADERGLLLAALDVLKSERDLGALDHCAAPVVETPDLQPQITQMRTELVAHRPLSPARAGAAGPSVSVVICTKDKGHLLHQLVGRLLQDCAELVADVVIVSNQTGNAFARRTLEHWAAHPRVKVIGYDRPFNFSDQCNLGVAASQGELLLFLNDDVVPVSSDWLSELVGALSQPDAGIAGPLLLYPDESVQHAGMHLGPFGTAGHSLRHARLPEEDYLFLATCARDVSCVTGAVLLMRRSLFDDLNGFDVQFGTIYQDVDLCLRTLSLGYRILYVPTAVLLHMESVSLLSTLDRPEVIGQRGREKQLFLARYGTDRCLQDQFLNPLYDRSDENLRTLSN